LATVTKIEDLLIWQEARVLVKGIFVLTNQERFSKEFALKDQIKRSAISVMSNIAEGFGRDGNKEFVQFLYIASGSLSELKTQLYISFDFNLLSEGDLNKFLADTFKLENMIKALIKKMKESEYTGTKYKAVSEQ
jgi:four helix bundle protein